MDSGHYVTFIKASDGKWYFMNDSHVRLLSNANVVSNNAYILFYVRQDVKNADFRKLFRVHMSEQEAELDEDSEEDEKKKCSVI